MINNKNAAKLLKDKKFLPETIIKSLIPSVEAYISQLEYEAMSEGLSEGKVLIMRIKEDLSAAKSYLELIGK